MRYEDAPQAGWYPDPDGRQRLRWWDGFDWTDIRRAPPSEAELIAAEENREFFEQDLVTTAQRQAGMAGGGSGAMSRQDVQQIIGEVREVARSEIDRAAQEFSNRATNAVRSISPLISDYTSQATKWVKRAIAIAVVLLVAYIVFQTIAQVSFFEWLGDRIDNLTGDDEASAGLRWHEVVPL